MLVPILLFDFVLHCFQGKVVYVVIFVTTCT